MANADPSDEGKLKKVFVIAPIGKLDENGIDFAQLCLEQIIRPAAQECGGYAKPERADEHHKPGSITAKIVTSILDADVCVADLTGRNANVMYEVAIAHAADKPVVLLQQEPGGPPFDFADERVIHYGLRVDLANSARRELVSHLRAANDEQEDVRLAATMNPVRLLFSQLKAKAEASDPEKAVLSELQAVRAELRDLRREPPERFPRTPPDGPDLDALLLTFARRQVDRGTLGVEDFHTLEDRLSAASDRDKSQLLRLLGAMDREPSDDRLISMASRAIHNIPPF